jgi:biopolymer transport protein ExbD
MRRGRPLLKSYVLGKCRARIIILLTAGIAWSCLVGLAAASRGDEFGRLEGAFFFELIKGTDAHIRPSLTFRELEALPVVLRDERTALVIAKTDQGNLAKMLVSPALRKLKPSEKDGQLLPVLILERFETIDAGDRRSFKARGKEVMLFDGFHYDLDAGQVVPEALGGDIVFQANAPDGPRLAAIDRTGLYTLSKPLAASLPVPGKPSTGRAIQPGDFAGRYQLMANGQWSGTLVLAIDPTGTVTGHFRSDRNGSAYSVTGKVATQVPQKIDFSVQFPRATQNYAGFLWTEGKNAIAGSVSMLDHPYSFIAIREGTSFGIEMDLSAPSTLRDVGRRRVVILEAGSDRYTFDGQARSGAELTDALSKVVKDEHAIGVLLRVGDAVSFEQVQRAADAIRAAGVTSVRLAPARDAGGPD